MSRPSETEREGEGGEGVQREGEGGEGGDVKLRA